MAQENNSSTEWYAARELAALGLPGLPDTVKGILGMAAREAWTSRPRVGRGGGQEYHLASLPAPTRSALLDHLIATLPDTVCRLPEPVATSAASVKALVPVETKKVPLPATALYKGWQRRAMDARCALLNLVEHLAGSVGITRAIDRVVAHAKAGSLPDGLQELVPVANARSGGEMGKQTLSRRTLYRWRDQRAQGVAALAPIDPVDDPRLPTERRNARVPAWAPLFLKCYRKPDKPAITDAIEEMAETLPAGMNLPSYSQAYRLLQKMSAVDRERGRRTGKDLKALQGFRRRDTSDLDPLDVGQCDGHSFKARVAHPVHGKPFHPEVCACIDAATRMALGWSAGLSESNQTVADALRHSCTVTAEKPYGGIFAIFYTDPGSGNKANLNADPSLGRYARLGIDFKTGIVGNSQARGMVEAFQKVWIKAAKQLPTFDGAGMDGTVLYKTTRLVDSQIKKTGRSELLPSWAQFLDHCQATIDRYNNRPHSSLPKVTDSAGRRRHMTPMECWNSHLAKGWVPTTLSEHELDDCFRPRIEVSTRRGEVRVFGNLYYHGDLVHHAGEKVVVEYAVQDGAQVWVRDRQERLICIAGFEANKSRMFAKTATEAAAEQRAARRLAVVERKRVEILEERQGVVQLATRPDELAAARAILIAQEQNEPKTTPLPIDDIGRLRFYRELQRRLDRGEALAEREQTWLSGYMRSSEFAILIELEQDLAVSK